MHLQGRENRGNVAESLIFRSRVPSSFSQKINRRRYSEPVYQVVVNRSTSGAYQFELEGLSSTSSLEGAFSYADGVVSGMTETFASSATSRAVNK